MSLRLMLAAPFIFVAAIAYFVMGFQLLLAIASFLGGASLLQALTQWIGNTILLGVAGTVLGVVAFVIGGPALRERM